METILRCETEAQKLTKAGVSRWQVHSAFIRSITALMSREHLPVWGHFLIRRLGLIDITDTGHEPYLLHNLLPKTPLQTVGHVL